MYIKRKRSIGTPSLSSLSLRLKLKELYADISACGFDAIAIKHKFQQLMTQLAVLCIKGMECELRCVKFLQLAQLRITTLVKVHDPMILSYLFKVPLQQRWQNTIQIVLNVAIQLEHPVQIIATAHDTTLDDIEMLMEAMELSKKEGISKWHQNEMQTAVPHLLAADRYMKRILLKIQQINIDQAMVEISSSEFKESSNDFKRMKSIKKRVRFNENPEILGQAQEGLDRKPISASKPSKLETLLIRAAREFPLEFRITTSRSNQ